MNSKELSRLKEETDLKLVWKHEAQDFTPWLADNIDILNEAMGLDISIEERESSIGSFNVDLYGREETTGRKVVIENQLEETNHDHLGKLITYASGKSAGIVIWVVKKARPEHRAAIEWLNEHTDDSTSFFLCEIKLYQIEDSPIAVKFDVVESPNEWLKISLSDQEMSESQQRRYSFWEEFLNYAYGDTNFAKTFGHRSPSAESEMGFFYNDGSSHIVLRQITTKNSVAVMFAYLNNTAADTKTFKELYERYGNVIEGEVGGKLSWMTESDKKLLYGRVDVPFDYKNHASWHSGFKCITDMTLKMRAVFLSHLSEVKSDQVDESLY